MICKTSESNRRQVNTTLEIDDGESPREAEATGLTRRSSIANSPPRQAFTEGEVRLAGYLVARQLDNRPVSEPLLDMLKRGNAAVEETREVMRLGRANVKADLEATGHLGYQAKLALRDVIAEGRISDHAVQAVLASSAGAGYCTEFAAVCHYAQMPALQPGESVVHVQSLDQNHSWDTLTRDGAGLTVVLDAWGDGPAVEASDARSMKPPLTHSEVKRTNQDDVPSAYEAAQRAQQLVELRLAHRLDAHVKRRTAQGQQLHPRQSWNPEPIVRKSFSKRAKRAVDQVTLPNGRTASPTEVKLRKVSLKVASKLSSAAARNLEALRQSQQQSRCTKESIAVEVAKSLGKDEAEAQRAAPRILESARRLGKPDATRVAEAAAAAADERRRADSAND